MVCTAAPLRAVTPDCRALNAQLATSFLETAPHGGKVAVPKSLVREGDLKARYGEEIEQRYASGKGGYYRSRDNRPIAFRVIRAPKPRGSLVLIPGLSENTAYYKELIYTLTEEGYTVYSYDPRGQGESGSLARDPKVVHVEKYMDYVDDLDWFLTKIVRPETRDYTVLGNSNGGLTAMRLASRESEIIPSLIAVSTPLRLQPELVPRPLLGLAVKASALVKGMDSFAPTQKTVSPMDDMEQHRYRPLRLNLQAQERAANPKLARGGGSHRWALEVIKAGRQAVARSHRLDFPTLLVTGTKDRVVSPTEPLAIADELPLGTSLSVQDARHFLLFERDKFRDPAMTEILRFLVNPHRLDRPAKELELETLVELAKTYEERGEPAFARYTLDEALRVYEAKHETTDAWKGPELKEDLYAQSVAQWERMKGMSPEQAVLYRRMTERRLDEIEKAYVVPSE